MKGLRHPLFVAGVFILIPLLASAFDAPEHAMDSGVFSGGIGEAALGSSPAPSVPENLSAVGKDAAIDVSWDPSSDNGGSPIELYRVYVSTVPGLFPASAVVWTGRSVGLAVSTTVHI